MIIERTLARLLVAMTPLGALACGMDAVGAGDRGVSAPTGAPGRPAGSAGGAATGNGDAAAAPDPTTSVAAVADSGAGSAADAAALTTCVAQGGWCAVTAECCAGLSCDGEDENRRCN
jgi:hypothetical protein